MKQLILLSGFNQNLYNICHFHEKIHIELDSPLLQILMTNEQQWQQNPSVIANPITETLLNTSRAIIQGFYQHIELPYVIDHNDLWIQHINQVEQIWKLLFDTTPMIITVNEIETDKQYVHQINQFLLNEDPGLYTKILDNFLEGNE